MSIFAPSLFGASRQPQSHSEQRGEGSSSQSVYQHRPFGHTQQQQHHGSRSPVIAQLDTPDQLASGSTSHQRRPSANSSGQERDGRATSLSAQNQASLNDSNSTSGHGRDNDPVNHGQGVNSTAGPSFSTERPSTSLTASAALASLNDSYSSTPPSKKRGRPRKWAREEDRRAAEAQRRRDKNLNKTYGIPIPPRPQGTYQQPPAPPESETGQPSTKTSFIHFDKDYGHHTPGAPGALSARDVLVNWLAAEGNWNQWFRWTGLERDAACRELKAVMEGHGMTEREVASVKQQITFIQRGAREARKFDLEGPFRELTPSEQRRIAPLVEAGFTPHQALLKIRWPYYHKLKSAVADEPLPVSGDTPDHPLSHEQDDLGQVDIIMDLDTIHRSPSTAALANTTLGQVLRSVEQWRGSQEPSEREIADVTSRANQLLGTAPTVHVASNPNAAQPVQRPSVPAMPPFVPAIPQPAMKAMTKREAEAWELEKQQIRQKLELEREERKGKAKISARELHLQSIKAFRDLLRDGLSKNAAGRMVWQEAWPAMKRQMSEEDD